jgi:hypothetical protein
VQGGNDAKDEKSLEEWLAYIAREEVGGDAAAEAALLREFQEWESLSKTAPNGKWRGANSRKWGKVGIEMRLTGNVPCTDGPVTELGKMVCKFIDIVDEQPAQYGACAAATVQQSQQAAAAAAAQHSPRKAAPGSGGTGAASSGSGDQACRRGASVASPV